MTSCNDNKAIYVTCEPVSCDFVMLRIYAYICADEYMAIFFDGYCINVILLNGRTYSFARGFRLCKCDGKVLWVGRSPKRSLIRKVVKLMLKINGNILVGF